MAKVKAKAPDWNGLMYKTVAAVLAAVVGAVATYLAVPPKVKEVEKIVIKTAEGVDYTPTFGWEKDPEVIARNLDAEKTLQFAETPAGKAVQGDADAFLWRAVRKAANKPDDWYPNINQGSVGSCVGAGNKHSVDVLTAVQIINGAPEQWKPVSAEVIYAFSRVEIGGGRISGDGSVGAWAADALRVKGVLPMEVIGGHDLSEYSASRARSWGRTGVPDTLEPTAAQHPVKTTALVRSAEDVKRAILQGYPVPVCSDQGFRMERDANGFCRASGTWYHCMAIIGYRADKKAFFILNSWGDQAHTGPVWPADAPKAGFWVDWPTVDRMARQGDTFALSDAVGFPARKIPLNWLIQARPVRVRDLFARFNDPIPEARLLW